MAARFARFSRLCGRDRAPISAFLVVVAHRRPTRLRALYRSHAIPMLFSREPYSAQAASSQRTAPSCESASRQVGGDRYDGRWGATVGLPTDPTAKSWDVFDNAQGKGIDALGYCHAVAAHLVGLCEELMALPAVDAHIVNPSPHSYSLRKREQR